MFRRGCRLGGRGLGHGGRRFVRLGHRLWPPLGQDAGRDQPTDSDDQHGEKTGDGQDDQGDGPGPRPSRDRRIIA
jgi:hypothetical protein